MLDNLKSIFNKNITFNANTPIVMVVNKRLSNIKYEVTLGKVKLTTKSEINLTLGSKYLVEVSQNKYGQIKIDHLKEIPSTLQNVNHKFTIGLNQFIFILSDIKVKYKNILIKKLINSKDKIEFEFYTIQLVNLLNNSINFPAIEYDGKYQSVQIVSFNEYNVYFKVFLQNLGPVEGKIDLSRENIRLDLNIEFSSSLNIIKNNLTKLGLDKKYITIKKSKDIDTDINYTKLVDTKG